MPLLCVHLVWCEAFLLDNFSGLVLTPSPLFGNCSGLVLTPPLFLHLEIHSGLVLTPPIFCFWRKTAMFDAVSSPARQLFSGTIILILEDW